MLDGAIKPTSMARSLTPQILSAALARILVHGLVCAGSDGRFIRDDGHSSMFGGDHRAMLLAAGFALSHSPYIGLDAPHEHEHADRQGDDHQTLQESLHRFHLGDSIPQNRGFV